MYLFYIPIDLIVPSSLERTYIGLESSDYDLMASMIIERRETVRTIILTTDEVGDSAIVIPSPEYRGRVAVALYCQEIQQSLIPIIEGKELHIVFEPGTVLAVSRGPDRPIVMNTYRF